MLKTVLLVPKPVVYRSMIHTHTRPPGLTFAIADALAAIDIIAIAIENALGEVTIRNSLAPSSQSTPKAAFVNTEGGFFVRTQ